MTDHRQIDWLYDEREALLQPVSFRARRLARRQVSISVEALRFAGHYLFCDSVHNFSRMGRRLRAREVR